MSRFRHEVDWDAEDITIATCLDDDVTFKQEDFGPVLKALKFIARHECSAQEIRELIMYVEHAEWRLR